MLFRNLYLISILCSLSASGQESGCSLSIRGQLNDEDNQEHLSYAVVSLLPQKKAVQSDDHGNFEFDNLCPGQYSLHISHVGCRDTVLAVNLTSSLKLKLKMPHSLNALYDVEVLAKHQEALPSQAVVTLQAKDLDPVRGADLATQLSRAPGITVLRTGPGVAKPVLNGMQGYRVLLLNHGVRLEGQQWGGEHAPEIDPFTASKLTVMKGAASVRYGSDAIAGVILVEADDLPDTSSLTGEVQGGYASNGRLYTAAARVQGYFDRLKYFSWRLQGSYRNGGDYSAPRYVLQNTGVREKNFSYEVGYHRKKFGVAVYYSRFNSGIAILEAAHAETMDELKEAISRGVPENTVAAFSREFNGPFQDITHNLLKVESDIHTGTRSRFKLLYASQTNFRKEFDEHGSGLEANPESAYELKTQNASLSWEHDYVRSWRGEFGVQGQVQNNVSSGDYFIPFYDARSAGFFAVERFVRPHYELEAGVRYDRKELNASLPIGSGLRRFSNLSYNVGALFRINRNVKLTVNAGSGWRAPAVNELYSSGLHHGAAAIERGSPYLDKEVAHSLVLGTDLEKGKLTVGFSASTYLFDNYIFYTPDSFETNERGTFPVFSFTQAPALLLSADFRAAYAITGYADIKTKAMWVRGSNSQNDEPLIYLPADRYEVSFRLHQDFKKAKEVYIEPGAMFVARQGRVPAGLDIVPPPPSYFLLNIEAGCMLRAGRQALFVTVAVNNLLNAEYRDYLDRLRYYAHAPGRNIMVRIRMPLTLFDKK